MEEGRTEERSMVEGRKEDMKRRGEGATLSLIDSLAINS